MASTERRRDEEEAAREIAEELRRRGRRVTLTFTSGYGIRVIIGDDVKIIVGDT